MNLGCDSFLGYNQLIANVPAGTAQQYTGLTVYGECKIDNIHFVDYIIDDENFMTMNIDINPTWTSNTIFLANFDAQNLQAGNITTLSTPITGWTVLRKEVGDDKYDLLDTVDDLITIHIDTKAKSRASYQYAILPIAGSVLGDILVAPTLATDFQSWYLSSEDGTKSYRMSCNVNTIARTSNESVSQKETAGQFDVFNRGNRDFISSSISFIPNFGYEADGYTIIQTQPQMRELELFIKNGLPKILKTPKGEIWKVYTTNPSFTPVNANNSIQLDYIDFDYAQIENL